MNKQIVAAISVLAMAWACQGSAQSAETKITEASGITRLGDDLLIVDDEVAGSYFRVPIGDPATSLIMVDPGRASKVVIPNADFALDLEAVDVLADGRVVVLSERLRALVTEDGGLIEYVNPLSEFGNMGLEGLAVRSLPDGSSRIAVLWEGGYPEHWDVPWQLRDMPTQRQTTVGRTSLQPVVAIHDLEAGKSSTEIKAVDPIFLQAPKLDGGEPEAQRFRAPDLVWHELDGPRTERWGFIVLLSSKNAVRDRTFAHQWLQRFDVSGQAVGDPVEIKSLLPEQADEKLRTANWEGLGWFEYGRKLVLVHDKPPKGIPTAVVVHLPKDWAAGYTHMVLHGTEYYLHGPQQAMPPDGEFREGTRLRIVQHAGSYTQIESESGIGAYVATDSPIRLAGSLSVEPQWHPVIDGAVKIARAYSDGPGWVLLHIDDNGRLGRLLGHAPLNTGWNEDIAVRLKSVPDTSTKIWAVHYVDGGVTNKLEAGGPPYTEKFCGALDRPSVVCQYRLGFLPDACLKGDLPGYGCAGGLPVGVFAFTAVP